MADAPPQVPSPGTVDCTFSTHCAVWLCALTSWNGSQNAGKDRSTLSSPRSSSTMMVAIQICGCAHPSYVTPCLLQGQGCSQFHFRRAHGCADWALRELRVSPVGAAMATRFGLPGPSMARECTHAKQCARNPTRGENCNQPAHGFAGLGSCWRFLGLSPTCTSVRLETDARTARMSRTPLRGGTLIKIAAGGNVALQQLRVSFVHSESGFLG